MSWHVLCTASGGVITVSQETPAAEAIRIMTDRNISAVIVVDKNDALTGMFTERDVVHCVEKGIALDKVPVKDVMGRNIITFEPSTEISAAISVIARKRCGIFLLSKAARLWES